MKHLKKFNETIYPDSLYDGEFDKDKEEIDYQKYSKKQMDKEREEELKAAKDIGLEPIEKDNIKNGDEVIWFSTHRSHKKAKQYSKVIIDDEYNGKDIVKIIHLLPNGNKRDGGYIRVDELYVRNINEKVLSYSDQRKAKFSIRKNLEFMKEIEQVFYNHGEVMDLSIINEVYSELDKMNEEELTEAFESVASNVGPNYDNNTLRDSVMLKLLEYLGY